MNGTTIQLVVKNQTGMDPFGNPIESEVFEDVEDVLVGQPGTDDVTNTIQLYGKKIEYVLGIPKGDKHDWEDREVIIWGKRYKTIGFPQTGVQENIPLRWGQNVRVERYG